MTCTPMILCEGTTSLVPMAVVAVILWIVVIITIKRG